jgi:type VI secretion system protein ImpA
MGRRPSMNRQGLDVTDIDALLAPVSDDAPCGADLEYDAQFMALEQAARGKPEQQYGDTVVPAEEPDWSAVISAAEELLQRTKDLRVAAYLARGWCATEGPVGLGRGLQLIHGLCDRYWEQVYPQLDPDDGYDPIMRMNALGQLVHPEAGLRELRESVCVRTRAGTLTVRQIEYVLGIAEPPEGQTVPSEPEALALLREAAQADAGLIAGLRAAVEQVTTLQSHLNEKVGSDQAVDFRPLRTMLANVMKLADKVAVDEAPAVAEGDEAVGEAGGEGAAPAGGGSRVVVVAGEIRSREDVMRVIDRVVEYLERHEPTNPAPLLLRRAQKLMTMNFLEIVEDLAPDGLSSVRGLAGLRD